MTENIELQLVQIKEKHFLRNWNQITYYDTSRMLLTFTIFSVFLPWIVYLFILACVFSYLISYLIFRNYSKTGILTITDKIVNINIQDKPAISIEVSSIQRMIVTYKFWKNRIINSNKQVEYNAIYIETSQGIYKFIYTFRNNDELNKIEEFFDQELSHNENCKILNLAYINIDDLI